jgi:carboxymethylenebutenolidase
MTPSRFLFLVVLLVFAQLGQAQDQSQPIPAPAESAQLALSQSPRHGEWVDIALPGAQMKLQSWVVYPQRNDKAPVVIVIHEIFGLTDWVRGVADQLAADGFIAIAPDLLSGKGENGGGTESFQGDSVRDAIRKLTPDEVAQRLNAVREYAIALPAATDKVAAIGFCWGGTASFTYAAHQPKLNAAIVYYGTAPADEAALAKIECPVIGFYGGDDARVTSTVDATAKAMAGAKKSFVYQTYDGAGHGFLRQQAGRDGANERAAQKSWAQTTQFLKKNLE